MAGNVLDPRANWTPGHDQTNPRDGTLLAPQIFEHASPGRPVEGKLVIPPPDQVSKGETIPCALVFKVPMPNLQYWKPQESRVLLTVDTEDQSDKIPHEVFASWQPREQIFGVRFLADDPGYMYFLIDDVALPAVNTFRWSIRVFIRVYNELQLNLETNVIEHKMEWIPDDLWWPGGRKPQGPQEAYYLAGTLHVGPLTEVKAEAGVKRRNPLSPEQQTIADSLAAIRLPPRHTHTIVQDANQQGQA